MPKILQKLWFRVAIGLDRRTGRAEARASTGADIRSRAEVQHGDRR
jgi:hypothetical protein